MLLLYFVNKYPDCPKIIYDFGPGTDETLARLAQQRPGTSHEEWTRLFNKHRCEYQKPSIDEGYDTIIEINNSDLS
jgi:fructosamine-3-kinase